MERSYPNRIGGYRVLGIAGRGQFGRVLCAYQTSTGNLAALKELDKYRFPTQKLLRELRFMIDLQHPNIVRCETILFAGGYRYLVMEYCEAGTLRDVMVNGEQLSVAQRLNLMIALLRGLACAHEAGIVHCDIKPENILLRLAERDWIVKISDFGIAHLAQELGQNSSYRTGSPAYMAPERFYGQFSASSDIYAVGIILYELFAHERPFQGTIEELMSAHLNQRPPLGKLPLPLQEVINKALAKLPPQRFSSANEMADVLHRLLVNQSITVSIPAPVLRLVQTPPQELKAFAGAIAWMGQQGFFAIGRELVGWDEKVYQKFPEPILGLRVVEMPEPWLYVATSRALYRYRLGYAPQLLYQNEQGQGFCYGVSASWLAVGSGANLDIFLFKYRKSRSLRLSGRLILGVVLLDEGHLVALTENKQKQQFRLIFLSRRGVMLGKLRLPSGIKTILPSLTPYRLIALENSPSLLLINLRPYRISRVLLPHVPELGIATVWGYAIVGGNVLMLIDLIGENLGNMQFPHPITQVISITNCELGVICQGEECSYFYRIDLQAERIELIF
jgi:serine/threonine-protein kinase